MAEANKSEEFLEFEGPFYSQFAPLDLEVELAFYSQKGSYDAKYGNILNDNFRKNAGMSNNELTKIDDKIDDIYREDIISKMNEYFVISPEISIGIIRREEISRIYEESGYIYNRDTGLANSKPVKVFYIKLDGERERYLWVSADSDKNRENYKKIRDL